ncbi:restriction endonuclease subunit S [Vibrio furnissii]|uniref:restriction endonuclease subunit S n=1 Tax=Vibrio furnissii TaxID=29494 RepID=UPI001EEB6A6F|nr:restriction endonuclease subunit S [Vibrio furnissii]MCG6266152.1 restriction endonuclease subunit S [Vibrio furnissii]
MTALSDTKKYQGYPEYKETGVEWLGSIPADWSVKRIQETALVISGYPFESKKFDPLVGTPLIRIRDIKAQKTEVFFNGEVPREALVDSGDVLVGMDGDFNVAMWKSGLAALNQRVACLRTDDKSLQKFLFYVLPFNMKVVNDLTYFTTVKHLSNNDILKTVYALPKRVELINIVNFLDHETAKIDTLIEKQQQLIKLLKEKRQAVISHAVTKGLNPQAPMKDSGVEWLGEVPEHWIVSRIKNFAKIDSGHTPSRQVEEYWIDCNIPWVSLNDSKTLKVVDYIDDTSNKINELGMANSSAHLLPERSVVFTRDASIGLSAIMSKPMAVSQHLIAWICNDSKLIPEFLLLIFYAMEKEFERYTFGATIKTIGMDDVRSLSGAFPPLEEQKVLVEWAFQKMASLKNGIDKAESVVDLLKERRTALISAAVTGKIDVRNWQAPTSQNQSA